MSCKFSYKKVVYLRLIAHHLLLLNECENMIIDINLMSRYLLKSSGDGTIANRQIIAQQNRSIETTKNGYSYP